jgi:hypothetical protein
MEFRRPASHTSKGQNLSVYGFDNNTLLGGGKAALGFAY